MPGASYSPAWVYWNYTPSYLGWCPVGYYGYYDNYYRSTRTWFGDGRGLTYPHLRGAVDVTQVSAGGWNYAQIPTIGTRLSARDVIRGDRVSFRPGEIGMIATAPLRLDRAGQSRIAIQEAVRRVSISEGLGQGARGTLPVNSGLTSILRRQVSLTPAGQEELRRSAVQVGRDPGYHPLPAEQIALGRRTDISGRSDISTRGGSASGSLQSSGEVEQRRGSPGTSGGTAGRPSDPPAPRSSWRETRPRITEGSPHVESPTRRDDASRPSPRTDEGWRSRGSSSAPRTVEPRREERAAPRRNDGGWRSPRADTPRSRDDSPRREAPSPRTETPRSESRREPPPSARSYEAPRHEAPAPRSEEPRSAPRAEPPAPRPEPRRESSSSSQRFESRTPTGSSSEGRPYASNRIEPRMESPVPRRYEAPAYRSYESPRPSAPAPRVSQPTYQAPARNESRPAPQASAVQAPAPQAPRGEARARTF